jgi:hypothetical protein
MEQIKSYPKSLPELLAVYFGDGDTIQVGAG